MHDDLTQFCADRFEKHVEELFAEAERLAKPELARGNTRVRAPITGYWYDSWSDEEAQKAQHLACAALVACARFKKDFPTWPDLPVSQNELDRLFYNLQQRGWGRTDAGDMQVFLMFGRSQCHHDWDLRHPNYGDFVCSVLANADAPDTIRENEALKKQFAPAPIVELFCMSRGSPPAFDFLHWNSPEMIARDRGRKAFHKTREAGGSVEECREAGRQAFRAALPGYSASELRRAAIGR